MFNQAFAELLDNGVLDQINNSAAFGAVGFNLDYKEIFFDSDRRPYTGVLPKSTESGTILGIYFNPRMTFFNSIYTDLYLDYFDDKLRFDGTKRDTYEAEIHRFWHKFFDADFKAGYIVTFFESHSLQVIPYVGAGYRYWYRQNNNGRVQEKYKHYKAIVGLKLNWLLIDDFVLSPYIEGGKIFNARMKYCGNDPDSPSLHGTDFTLGNKPIYTGGLELNYRVFDEFFLNGFASYTQFKYGRSPSYTDGVFEPDSKTSELKFGLGVRYSWLVN